MFETSLPSRSTSTRLAGVAMNVLPLGRRWATSGEKVFFSQTTSPLLLRSVTRLPLYSARRTRSPGNASMSSGISTPLNFQRTFLSASRLRISLSSSMTTRVKPLGRVAASIAARSVFADASFHHARHSSRYFRRETMVSSANRGDLSPARRKRASSAAATSPPFGWSMLSISAATASFWCRANRPSAAVSRTALSASPSNFRIAGSWSLAPP